VKDAPMTFPVVTEIAVRLTPVEHDDFIDSLERPEAAVVIALPARPATDAPLRAAA
jgi:hypothetical protein